MSSVKQLVSYYNSLREEEEEECNDSTHTHKEEKEEEEEKALSLGGDLPIINEENTNNKSEGPPLIKTQDDFDFHSWDTSISREAEMCAAEDVFFHGQIIPLQHLKNEKRCVSSGSSAGFTSRSSSSNSLFSSSSTSSASKCSRYSNPRMINHFHTQPSPKPQIKLSTNPQPNHHRIGKSPFFEFFKLGLIPMPVIELQHLKIHERNFCHKKQSAKKEKPRKQGRSNKEKLFSGCDCSLDAVKQVSLNNIVTVKNNGNHHTVKSKDEQETKKKKKKGKSDETSHRKFDWINELSFSELKQHSPRFLSSCIHDSQRSNS